MSIRSLRRRSTYLLLPALFSAACAEDHAFATPTAELQAAVRNEDPPPALSAEKIVGGGGLNLAVYETGDAGGPPIVFIHGFTGSHLSWQSQFSRPLTDFRLVTYELRGHGASDKPLDAARYTDAALWADDLDAVIRARNLDRPVLVGWSYGGYVIADYVRKYGDSRIGGLVFVGATAKLGTPEAAASLSDEVLALFPDILSPDVRRSIDGTRSLARMFTKTPLRGNDFEIAYGSAMMVPPEVRLAMFSRVLDNDDVLAAIRVPTLVIQGAGDRIVRTSAARHIAGKVPRAELLIYNGAGHAPHLETPQRFNRDLGEFVREIRRNPKP